MEKRKIIMEKALELFAEQGFSTTSVQEITERSGISKGAFYLSFKSKDELILALIHEFLQKFMSDIDLLVSESVSDELLYNFYTYHFESFYERSDFAKIFMKEQAHFLNEDFFAQMVGYNEMIQETILTMLEKVYGKTVTETKYDLVYTIQGLMKSYMELLLFGNIPLDIKKLAVSLVEKTDALAHHMTVPGITEDYYLLLQGSREKVLTEEKLLQLLDDTILVLDESVEKESLQLLKKELRDPVLSKAVVAGLLKNIKNHPSSKRVSYLLQMYWDM